MTSLHQYPDDDIVREYLRRQLRRLPVSMLQAALDARAERRNDTARKAIPELAIPTGTAGEFLRFAAHFGGFSIQDLLGSKRHKPLASYRQVTTWALRRAMNLSMADTAELMQYADHTSVVYAEARVEKGPLREQAEDLLHKWNRRNLPAIPTMPTPSPS